jgi:hypothetical protein
LPSTISAQPETNEMKSRLFVDDHKMWSTK